MQSYSKYEYGRLSIGGGGDPNVASALKRPKNYEFRERHKNE